MTSFTMKLFIREKVKVSGISLQKLLEIHSVGGGICGQNNYSSRTPQIQNFKLSGKK